MYNFDYCNRNHYVISKENPVSNTGGSISLSANSPVLINPADPLTGSYQILTGNMHICCDNYLERPAGENLLPLQQKTNSSEMHLYPNPVKSNIVKINYHFEENGSVTASIYSAQGILLQSFTMPFEDNTRASCYAFDLSKYKLSAGIYLIRLNNGTESLTQKLIITH